VSNIFIMIPIFNKENFTKACINDLSNLDGRHKIILVDNGSSDRAVNIVETLVNEKNNDSNVLCEFYIFKFKENKGFGKASNYAYKIAREKFNAKDEDFFIYLNNDIRVKSNKEGWTDLMVKAATRNNIVGPTGGLVDENYNFVYETENINKPINYMSCWVICVKGDTAERIANEFKDNEFVRGIFPDYNLAYFEDTHMSFVAAKLGIEFKIVQIPVVHFKRTTSKTMNLSKLYTEARINFLNRIKK